MKNLSQETQAKVDAILNGQNYDDEIRDIIQALAEVDKQQQETKYLEVKKQAPRKVIVGYYEMTADGSTHIFYNSGRAEQALRAFVHEGYKVTIREVKAFEEHTEEEIRDLRYKGAVVEYIYDDDSLKVQEGLQAACEAPTAVRGY